SQRALEEAHSGYYGAMGDLARAKGDAANMNAMTRRIKAYGDIVERLGPDPKQAVFDRENQPGGIINVACGGPVKRDEWPTLYKQAQLRRNSTVDEEAARAEGMSEETISALRRSKLLSQELGQPKRGYIWDIDPQTKAPVQTLLAEKED